MKIKVKTPIGEMKEATVIGPSNLGVLFGVNKYEDMLTLFLKLTARKIRESSQFAERGIDMEKYIAMEYAERVLPETCGLQTGVPFKKHPTMDYFGCYTDGDVYEIVPGEKPEDKDKRVYSHSINIKTISSDFGAENFDDPVDWVKKQKPDWIYQAQGEMTIDGSNQHDIVVWPSPVAEYDDFLRKLVSSGALEDKSFRDKFFDAFPILAVITIPRDEDIIKEIEKKVTEFWENNIVADTPPPVEKTETKDAANIGAEEATINDEQLVKALEWIKQTRETLDSVEEKVWPRLAGVDAHKIFAGNLVVYKNANTPRKSLNTDMLLYTLPTETVKKVVNELEARRIVNFDADCTKEDFIRSLEPCTKGIDYSVCYKMSEVKTPFNFRFGKAGKKE